MKRIQNAAGWGLSILAYEVILLDRPGLGYSETIPGDDGDPRTEAALLHAALTQLGIERPLLIGHSRGGVVALAYTLHYPQEVASTVLLAAGAYDGRDAAPMITLANLPLLGDLLLNVYAPLARAGGYALVRGGLDPVFWPDGETPPAYLKTYGALWARPSHIDATAADRAFPVDARLAPHYPEIDAPVIIVQGEKDRSVPVTEARRLAQALLNARLHLIPDTGHELMFFQADAILRILQTLPRSPEKPGF